MKESKFIQCYILNTEVMENMNRFKSSLKNSDIYVLTTAVWMNIHISNLQILKYHPLNMKHIIIKLCFLMYL